MKIKIKKTVSSIITSKNETYWEKFKKTRARPMHRTLYTFAEGEKKTPPI